LEVFHHGVGKLLIFFGHLFGHLDLLHCSDPRYDVIRKNGQRKTAGALLDTQYFHLGPQYGNFVPIQTGTRLYSQDKYVNMNK